MRAADRWDRALQSNNVQSKEVDETETAISQALF
jgi:hypothetical protein